MNLLKSFFLGKSFGLGDRPGWGDTRACCLSRKRRICSHSCTAIHPGGVANTALFRGALYAVQQAFEHLSLVGRHSDDRPELQNAG